MRRYEPKPWDIRRCDMIHADEGEYVLYCDAQAEIERLTKERDEARAQVAAAYEVVAIRSENYACGAPYNQRATINALANHLRGMTPADAKAALETYVREKMREGMQRAADIAYAGKNSAATSDHRGQIKRAIIADMEKLK